MCSSGHAADDRVLLLVPTRRDGEVTCRLLADVGLDAMICTSLPQLAAEIRRGAAALLLADTALAHADMHTVTDALAGQPAWSDIPTVILVSARAHSPTAGRALEALRNVTLLDRPTSTRSVISALQAATRSRARQYEIRDQIESIRRAEESLRETAANLSDSNRRQREFLATLAHELRNPLASISAGLEVIRQAAHDPARVEHSRVMMERQTRQLVRLVDDQLDLSRVIQGKLRLQRSLVTLEAVLQQAVETVRATIDAEGHTLTTELPEQPVLLDADPHRLAQVFSNLLHNAAKFTRHGGHIALTATVTDAEAVVAVTDNGIGISEAMQPAVFELFAQIDRPREFQQTGLGIGLTMVQRLVEMHEGRVEVSSDGPDRGSTFTVHLPLADSALLGDADAADAADATAAGVSRILVVDDNQDAAEMMRMMLELMGNTVRVAHDGVEAVAAADEFRPDLVLMDIGMPRMNGYEAAGRIREQSWGQEMRLVALTGWGQEDDRQRATAAGFDGHLTKPASPEALERLVHSTVRHS